MVYATLLCLLAKTSDGAVTRTAAYSPKGLYKFLIRQCNRLPHEEISAYYKHHVRQSFNQHADETDPERVTQIINQAAKDIHIRYLKMELLNREETDDSFVVESNVSSVIKFFHALSTFATRPELMIPHIRSTDLDWTFVDESLRKCGSNLICENLFEFMYSSIYHQGKCVPSEGGGELSGSLYEQTIRSWVGDRDGTGAKVFRLRRQVHHKPRRDMKLGWTSFLNELWDFNAYLVKLVPIVDSNSKPFPYVPFVTLEAKFFEKEQKARFTVKRFVGPLVPDVEDGMEFYKTVCIPKLIEWMSDEYNVELPKLSRLRARPLSFINNGFYWQCYDMLKSVPAEEIKSIWEESTDPVKFIHEDIGIASYIASFIYGRSSRYLPVNNTDNIEILDLGCGNGLLCYLISQLLAVFSKTGKVVGFDIRRRKIWKHLMERFHETNEIRELYRQSAAFKQTPCHFEDAQISLNLIEKAFVPHKMDDLMKTFACPGIERQKKSLWIIGNHSDELTPWIPVVARRLNATGFFIIPCCPYDFFKKYQRQANIPGSSKYFNYIEYVCTIGDKFGYLPTLEKLRIPSTKNICLIGIDCSRKFDNDTLNSRVQEIMKQLNDGDQGSSISKFVPRQRESGNEAPKLDKVISQSIVDKIFEHLIRDWKNAPTDKWYTGRQNLTFRDITEILTQGEKEMLKGKGNGLKTLIRSNRNLFTVDDFYVRLRIPDEKDFECVSQTNRNKIKTRICYFYRNHPQGCPLPSELCTFKH